jgi:peptidyl-prolyl cis-trans isomerase C
MSLSIRTAAVAGAAALLFTGALHAQNEGGVDIDQNVLDLFIESRIQQPANQATPEQADALRDQLTDIYLLSEQARADELKKDPQLMAQLELQERVTIAQAVAQDFITRNQATDEEMQSLYDEQMKEAPPIEYKARHILVETQSEAQDIIKELEGGADFAELATEKSTGPSGPSGGDLGWFSADRMVPEFSRAVVELEDGAYTKDGVQTQFGWHVILREDSRESTPPPYESMRQMLKQRVEGEKLQEYLESLRQ